MDIKKEREAFEDNFRKTELYRRECAIRGKDILEFSKTMGAYFNIVTNDAWNMWQVAKAQAVPEGYVLVSKEPTQDQLEYGYRCGSTDAKRIYSAMITSYEDY